MIHFLIENLVSGDGIRISAICNSKLPNAPLPVGSRNYKLGIHGLFKPLEIVNTSAIIDVNNSTLEVISSQNSSTLSPIVLDNTGPGSLDGDNYFHLNFFSYNYPLNPNVENNFAPTSEISGFVDIKLDVSKLNQCPTAGLVYWGLTNQSGWPMIAGVYTYDCQ